MQINRIKIPVPQTTKVATSLFLLKIFFSSFIPKAAMRRVPQEDNKYKEVFGGAKKAKSIFMIKINIKDTSRAEKLNLKFFTTSPMNK